MRVVFLSILFLSVISRADNCGTCKARSQVSVLIYDRGISDPRLGTDPIMRNIKIPVTRDVLLQTKKYFFEAHDDRTEGTTILEPIPVSSLDELKKKIWELARPPTCQEVKYLGLLFHGRGDETKLNQGGGSTFFASPENGNKFGFLDMSTVKNLEGVSCAMAKSAEVDLLSCSGFYSCQGENLAAGLADMFLKDKGGKVRGYSQGVGGYISFPLPFTDEKRIALDARSDDPKELKIEIVKGIQPIKPQSSKELLLTVPASKNGQFGWSSATTSAGSCNEYLHDELTKLREVKNEIPESIRPSRKYGQKITYCNQLNQDVIQTKREIGQLESEISSAKNDLKTKAPKQWDNIDESFYEQAKNFDLSRIKLRKLKFAAEELNEKVRHVIAAGWCAGAVKIEETPSNSNQGVR